MRYIIINSIPYDVSKVSIPNVGVKGYSLYDIFNQLWFGNNGLKVETEDLLKEENKYVNDLPEDFRKFYMSYRSDLKQLAINLSIAKPVMIESISERESRIRSYIDNYLHEHGLTREELNEDKIFRFSYIINKNSENKYINSSWYTSYDEAFSSLVKFVNVLNGIGEPVVDI